jgi:hypothetical protein
VGLPAVTAATTAITTTAAAAHTAAATTATGTADALEAVAAVDWAVASGLEGNLGGLATAAADYIKELTLHARSAATAAITTAAASATTTVALVTTHRAAGAATLRLGKAPR